MDNKILTLCITLVVCVILAGSLMVPLLNDVTKTTETFANEGYYNVAELGAESDYKLYWDHTAPYQITVNDTDIISFSEMGLNDYQAVTVLGSNEFCLRFYNVTDNPRMQLYGGTGWGFGGASVSAGTDMTVEIVSGDLSITTTAETPLDVTKPVPTKLYGIASEDTGLVMKKANVPAYVLDDTSVIVLCGFTEGGGLTAGVYAEGTVNDGLEYTLYRPAADAETAEFSNEVITATDVNGYIGLKSLEKIEFDVAVTGGTIEPTYTYFIVPAEVTAELSEHLTSGEIALINVLPVLVIVALLLAAVGAVVIRRND